MDNKSKVLIAAFLVLIAATAVWKYQTLVVQQNFVVHDYVSCDPEIESCFQYCEDGECEDEPYKKIEKSAQYIPLCKTYESDECEELACAVGEEDCEVTYCSEDVLDEGEQCYVYDEDEGDESETEENAAEPEESEE